jgi:hypothetical protein
MLETRLSRGSNKEELFDNLFQSIDEEFGDSRSVLPFHEWVERSSISLDGRPFSFERHEYLVGIYEAMSDPKVREINIEKAAQMGVTVGEVLESFHGMKYGRYPKGVLYLLPTEHHMERVSKTKIQPIINENPDTLQKWITKTDSASQKAIGGSNFILHGMGSRVSLKSYSVDSVRFDELEEIEDWTHVALAEERMSHSEVKWLNETIQGGTVHRFSVPSLPEYGINSFFAGKPSDSGFGHEIEPSDQRYWMLKCRACGEYTCLEDEFPECIVEISAGEQKAIRLCRKCRRELDILQGEWVAKKPGQRAVGFHISQLFSAYINPWKLLDQYRKKKDLTTLYNDKIGIPYIESNARIEMAEVLALCGTQRPLTSFPGPCGMGIDQPKEEGQNFHVTIAYKKPSNLLQGQGHLVQVIFVDTRTTWADLDNLMRSFNVSRCVVDGLPDQDKARAFAGRFPGKVFLSYYAEKQKGAYHWNEKDYTVSVDRTESLNASTAMIHDVKVIFPQKSEQMITFAKHCHNMARKSQEDKDTGTVRQIWVKTGADHYRHSWNYCLMALEEVGIYQERKNIPIPTAPNLAKSYAVNLDFKRRS